MKKVILMACLCVFMTINALSQMVVTITIESNDKAAIAFTLGGSAIKAPEFLDFTTTAGSIIIDNKTASKNYFIMIGPTIRISDGTDGFAFPVNTNATITVAAGGVISPKIGTGTILKGSNILVRNSSDKEIGAYKSKTPKANSPIGTVDKTINQKEIDAFAKQIAKSRHYRYIREQNIYVDNSGVIHIFLDENLQPILSNFPTTARESNDLFQFHFITTSNDFYYRVNSEGEFSPISIAEEIGADGFPTPQAQSTGLISKKILREFPSPVFGPYTESFPFTIEKISRADDKDVLVLTKSIKLLHTSRVSLNIGAVSTWLKDASNIQTFVKPNGDTTLSADDPNVRGQLIAMITFYLKPRNLNVAPRDFREKIGITFGTNLTGKIGNNFFGGLNIEVANGLLLNGGVHFARVNYVANYEDFKFGEDVFSSPLRVLKKWNAGLYLGVNIDAGLFTKAFKKFLGASNDGN